MNHSVQSQLLKYQKNEITEHRVYAFMSRLVGGKNAQVLKQISEDEMRHYHQFKKMTGKDIGPNHLKIWLYSLASLILGLTFVMKMMEKGEEAAEENYTSVQGDYPDIAAIIADEIHHEKMLLSQIEDERLRYLGSIALSLNNSVQEFTGIVVGLTFAMRDARMTGATTLVSGLAATLAMMASEYLSQKSEKHAGSLVSPLKASLYAGAIYLLMVILIVLPYFFLSNHYQAMAVTVSVVIVVMFLFSYFMSIVKDQKFFSVLIEGVAISSLVVIASFAIGTIARTCFGFGH